MTDEKQQDVSKAPSSTPSTEAAPSDPPANKPDAQDPPAEAQSAAPAEQPSQQDAAATPTPAPTVKPSDKALEEQRARQQEQEQLDREIAEALGDHSVEELVEQSTQPEAASEQTGETQAQNAEAGAQAEAAATGQTAASSEQAVHHDMRRGRISAIRGDDVFVDLTGDKMQGIVPLTQFDRQPRVGSIMDFVVDRIDEGQGLVFLSREGAVSRATWEQLQRGANVEARVIASNKGGLDLEMVGGIRAFMPASQIDTRHVEELDKFVGEKLQATVQEIDRKSKRVVLSRRQYLQAQREAEKKKTLDALQEGDTVEGSVSSVVEFGAFVDLGGVDGLVHISDLSYQHVKKPQDVVKQGDKVKCKVLKIDPEKQRISLGMKQVEPDPWDGVAETIQQGENISGRVVRTANFGAFVEITPGVEGLLPLSEMSWKRIGKAEEVCKAGDIVHVKVISADLANHKITLSLKQAQGDPWEDAEALYPRHSLVNGKVISTTDFGAFVEIKTGLEGLVHISELSDRRVGKVTDVLTVGDEKEFRVLEIDPENRKIKLSLKQVSEPAPEQATAAQPQGKRSSAKRKKPKDLKSGLGSHDGMGMGLGDLKL